MAARVSGAVKRYSSKRGRERHCDGLGCSPLKAGMCDNVIRFVDGHIFNDQAHRTLALAHGGLGAIPELAEAFRDPIYLGAFFRAYLVLIALVVAFFDGSCLF